MDLLELLRMRLIVEIVLIYLAYKIGWTEAHVMVAKECERLGSFFVGKKVYHCNLIIEKEEKNASKES